jgi:hypothetical protein
LSALISWTVNIEVDYPNINTYFDNNIYNNTFFNRSRHQQYK